MRTSPENTLKALSRAKEEGVDGIEFDVQLSADGEPFLFHDDNALRVCGRDVEIARLPWRKIRELRAFGHHPIPHLDEMLAAMADWRGAELYLDLHQPSVPLAETTARRLAASDVRSRSFILDFYKNRALLAAAKRAAPTIRIAVMPGPPWQTARSCALGAEAISLGWDGKLTRALYRAASRLYDVPAAIAAARRRGVAVNGGVANDPGEVAYFLAQGLDGIWTDDLVMARRALLTNG